MMGEPMPIEEDDGEMDIYAALGLNTPVGPQEGSASPGAVTEPYDPLAAFMDDDDEDDAFPAEAFATSSVVSTETVEFLLETLARDLLDHERLSASVSGGRIDMDSLTVERDRDAYHLSLIIDMGGQAIKPFATVLAVEDAWKPMAAPRGLHARWTPVYEALCKALTEALSRQGRPSSL
tara:strand:- start:4813 stop:5349 length:537 start_codon:yes stop_codon:yes gene_type:complete